jgi:hypothetical protein
MRKISFRPTSRRSSHVHPVATALRPPGTGCCVGGVPRESDLVAEVFGTHKVKRRTDVVGVFPNPATLLALAGAVLVEAHDEWQVSERRYLSEASMALLATPPGNPKEVATPALLTA